MLKLLVFVVFAHGLIAIKIDNELQVVKNDCYERMAIGQRLAAKSVYKAAKAKTVAECQRACTKEQEVCKSFSFGVGVKGNTTCELSNDPVKETADLKPVGTQADTDFDLYIKKLGCTLVLDQGVTKKPEIRPVHEESYAKPSLKPLQIGVGPPAVNYEGNSKPNYGLEHVQTLVSISSGPQKPVLHPIHEILVSEETYNYGRPSYERPSYPYRPADTDRYDSFNRPIPERYGNYIPRPEDYGRPRPEDYYQRPHRFDMEYGPKPRPPPSYRPNPPSEYGPRPDYGPSYIPPRPAGYEYGPPPEYGLRPGAPPENYGSRPSFEYVSRPNGYEKPEYGLRPKPPADGYDSRPSESNSYDLRPSSVRPPAEGYDYPRPKPPPSNNYESRPNPPSEYNKPSGKPDGYGSKPSTSSAKPPKDYLFDHNPNSYGNDKPSRPGGGDSGYGAHKPIVTQSVGSYGEKITSIITELDEGR